LGVRSTRSYTTFCTTHKQQTSLRYLAGAFRQEQVLARIRELISQTNTHGFTPIALEPHIREGAVFVRFRYNHSDTDDVLSDIESALNKRVAANGGVPSANIFAKGSIWVVRGKPWREVRITSARQILYTLIIVQDMNRFPTAILRVAFDGPDLTEESVYEAFRVCLFQCHIMHK
jgi:hypothetical protein